MSTLKTAELIAARHGVDERTVRRAGKRYEAVEKLRETAPALADDLSAVAKRDRAKNARAAVKERNPVKRDPDLANDVTAKSEPKPKSRAAAAGIVGVSERKVRDAIEVRKADKALAANCTP